MKFKDKKIIVSYFYNLFYVLNVQDIKYQTMLIKNEKSIRFMVLHVVLNVFYHLPSYSLAGMKRPFSPSSFPFPDLERNSVGRKQLIQMNSESCFEIQNEGEKLHDTSQGGTRHSPPYRPKRERKQRTYTLCEVCNIQLNSAAQAQIHYNGKSHQKRLKQISSGKMPGNTGRPPGAAWLTTSWVAEWGLTQILALPSTIEPCRLTESHTVFTVQNHEPPCTNTRYWIQQKLNKLDPVCKNVFRHSLGVRKQTHKHTAMQLEQSKLSNWGTN